MISMPERLEIVIIKGGMLASTPAVFQISRTEIAELMTTSASSRY